MAAANANVLEQQEACSALAVVYLFNLVSRSFTGSWIATLQQTPA
jgi:hypothetical protein